MRHFSHLLAVGTLSAGLAVGGLTGCTSPSEKEAKETGRTTEQVKTDKAISDQVAKAMETAPVYKYSDVKVSTMNGVVQLSGFVLSEDQKQAATRIAQESSGGRQVENNLVVQPLTPTGRPGQTPQETPPQNSPPTQQPNQGTP